MKFNRGDVVAKNPDTWRPSEFDAWGAGRGTRVVVDVVDEDTVDVQWAGGRCYQGQDELLPVEMVWDRELGGPVFMVDGKPLDLSGATLPVTFRCDAATSPAPPPP